MEKNFNFENLLAKAAGLYYFGILNWCENFASAEVTFWTPSYKTVITKTEFLCSNKV